MSVVWRVLVLQGMLLLTTPPSGQAVPARFQSIEEWNLWKEDHSKEYSSNMVCNPKIHHFISYEPSSIISRTVYVSNLNPACRSKLHKN